MVQQVIESVWLVHPEREMCDAFAERFVELPNVRVSRGRFEDLEPHDCFVLEDSVPGPYVGCRQDRVVRTDYQATVATTWLKCGHEPMRECPEALAALL